MNKRELGLKKIREVLGGDAIPLIEGFEKISPDFANYIIEFGYGDIYAREALDDKSREIAIVSNLIGQGLTGIPLKSHLSGMLNVGWTKKEIIELIIFLAASSGFPKSVEAIKIAQEVFDNYKK